MSIKSFPEEQITGASMSTVPQLNKIDKISRAEDPKFFSSYPNPAQLREKKSDPDPAANISKFRISVLIS